MRATGKKRFIQELPNFVRSLNTRHLKRLGGLQPIEITVSNQWFVAQGLRNKAESNPTGGSGVFTVGSLVRVQLPKTLSSDKSLKFSDEVFKVKAILDQQKPFLYKLCDIAGVDLNSLWYGKQLAIVKRGESLDERIR